jgi:hypothetical protein
MMVLSDTFYLRPHLAECESLSWASPWLWKEEFRGQLSFRSSERGGADKVSEWECAWSFTSLSKFPSSSFKKQRQGCLHDD